MSEYEPKKRWLDFIDQTKKNQLTKRIVVGCGNKWLGDIKWDSGWRQYVFDDGDLKLAEGCAYEIFEKMKQLREERESEYTKVPTVIKFRRKDGGISFIKAMKIVKKGYEMKNK